MAALVIGALTVRGVVAAPRTVVEAIDRERAFDNTMLATQIAAAKDSWAFQVTNRTAAQLAAIEAALAAAPPIACSGDLLGGAVNCYPEVHGSEPVPDTRPIVFNLSFTLHRS